MVMSTESVEEVYIGTVENPCTAFTAPPVFCTHKKRLIPEDACYMAFLNLYAARKPDQRSHCFNCRQGARTRLARAGVLHPISSKITYYLRELQKETDHLKGWAEYALRKGMESCRP